MSFWPSEASNLLMHCLVWLSFDLYGGACEGDVTYLYWSFMSFRFLWLVSYSKDRLATLIYRSHLLQWVSCRLGVSVRLLALIDEFLVKFNHGVESDFSVQRLFDLRVYLWPQVRSCSIFKQFLVIWWRRFRVKMNLLLLFQTHSRELDELFAFSCSELDKKSHGYCSKLFNDSYQVKFCGDWMPCLIV